MNRFNLADMLFRIQKRLDKLGLAESAACKMAGLSDSAIRNWRRAIDSGNTQVSPTVDTVFALAAALLTTVAWLLDGQGPEEFADYVINQPTIVSVPLISWETAGNLGSSGAILLPQDILRVLYAVDLDPNGDWIALRVSVDAMDRVVPPESIIFVDRRDRRLEPLRYYVLRTDSDTLFRRFRPPNIWEPFSTKPQHKPLEIPDGSDPVIIGRVKKYRSNDL
jgi:transcriptional regulator with XRE-family HTH domain